MSRKAASFTGQNTFEQERSEAVESALAAAAERPGDHVTRSACAFLLTHLLRDAPERTFHSLSPAA